MKIFYRLSLNIAFYFIYCIAVSQTDTVINGKHFKLVDEKTKTKTNQKQNSILDSTFTYKDKKYQYYNNWFTAGAGVQQNLSYKKELGFAGGLDFHLHWKQHYFQTGLELMGKNYGSYDNYQLHLGYGKRFEDADVHFSIFAGISYSTGYQQTQLDSVRYENRYYKEPGLYFQSEIIKKIKYDVGIGFSLFGDFNQEQSLLGLRAVLYFSGAYLGKRNSNNGYE